MSLDSSKLPIEARIDQLMNRIDSIAAPIDASLTKPVTKQQDFQTMIAMMQMEMETAVSSESEVQNELMPFNFHSFQPPASSFQASESLLFPLKGRISSDYGKRSHPITGHAHFHNGIDIAAKRGASIRMPYSGTVAYVGKVSGFGNNTVIVAHKNQRQADGQILYSVFGHNDNVFVQAGDTVKQGEIFATVGNEGNSTGPHLHWETRIAPQGIAALDVFKQEVAMTVDPTSLA